MATLAPTRDIEEVAEIAEIAEAMTRATPASDEDRALLERGRELMVGSRTLSVGAVAKMLGVSSPTTIHNWLEQGVFPGVDRTPGGHRRFNLADVMAVRARMEKTKAENEAGIIEIPEYGDDEDPYARR
jgi:excisionase family DNA binding protein